MRLSKTNAAKYALVALEIAQDKQAPVWTRQKVGPVSDEAVLARLSNGAWLLYIDGSDMDTPWEWMHNAGVCADLLSFDSVVKDLQTLLAEFVSREDLCVFVGFSRGAAIVLSLAQATNKDDHVITLGDPGLVRPSDDGNVVSLRNQFDLLYGIIGNPVGDEHDVSQAYVTRTGWRFELQDVGYHTNYVETLKNEAAQADIADIHPVQFSTHP